MKSILSFLLLSLSLMASAAEDLRLHIDFDETIPEKQQMELAYYLAPLLNILPEFAPSHLSRHLYTPEAFENKFDDVWFVFTNSQSEIMLSLMLDREHDAITTKTFDPSLDAVTIAGLIPNQMHIFLLVDRIFGEQVGERNWKGMAKLIVATGHQVFGSAQVILDGSKPAESTELETIKTYVTTFKNTIAFLEGLLAQSSSQILHPEVRAELPLLLEREKQGLANWSLAQSAYCGSIYKDK